MILLLNDTSLYHNGCKEVVKNIDFDKSLPSVRTNDLGYINSINFTDVDLVILNGEGTMHHNQKAACAWIGALSTAQKLGIETRLINSVWQEMDQRYADVLKNCSRVEVREVLSQNELLRQGVDSVVVPDLSVRTEVPIEDKEYVKIYKGQSFYGEPIQGNYPEINIFKDSWNDIVNKLRNSDLLITGRHHEMYAAIKARCRFIAYPGNTWKNEGVMLTHDKTIEDVLHGKYDEEYEKVFNWANK